MTTLGHHCNALRFALSIGVCVAGVVSLVAALSAPAHGGGMRITLPAPLVPMGPAGPIMGPGGGIVVGPGAMGIPAQAGIAPPAGGGPATTPPGNRSGLLLTIDTTWVDVQGYRPVRVSIQPVKPTTADRSLRINLQPGRMYGGASLSIARDIELPAGFTKVDFTISVPEIEAWGSFDFDVFEDGTLLPELSLNNFNQSAGQNWGQPAAPTVLFLGRHGTSIFNGLNNVNSSNSLHVSPNASTTQNVSTSTTYGGGRQLRLYNYELRDSLTADELPTNWIDYQGIDIVVGSLTELRSLVTDHPGQWQALRMWVSTGGNLCIYGMGDEPKTPWKKLPEFEKLLDLRPRTGADASNAEVTGLKPDLEKRGWTRPEYDQMDLDVYQRVMNTNQMGSIEFLPNGPNVDPSQSRESKRANPPSLISRELGHGMVVAILPEQAIDHSFDWRYVFIHLGNNRAYWSLRNGVSLQQANNHVWNFLIPGVGDAPVTTFQLLITVFVIVIGPINYILLKRWRRLNLLLITIPVSAAIVTGLLLLYAIVADGFDVQVRSRSITWIDQRRGEAACLGRATYYAGLAPSDGLRFAGDVAALPLEASPAINYGQDQESRSIDWSPAAPTDEVGTQHFAEGWLKSREQTQMVTTRARKTKLAIDFSQRAGGTLRATNRLDTPIEFLVAWDGNGECHWGEAMSDEGTSVDLNLAVEGKGHPAVRLTEYFLRRSLLTPTGMTNMSSYSRTIFGIRRGGNYYGYGYNNNMMIGSMSEGSRLEQQLNQTFGATPFLQRVPNRYVAIVERSPELDLGLTDVRHTDGLHVIVGEW